jgi:predicted aspartyl protease
MAGPSTIFRPVIGKVDTGADRTMLTLNTARTLGIMDPADGALEEKAFTLANGQKLLCHTHTISVDLSTLDQTIPRFLVYAGVSDKLVNNLFGREWLTGGMCIAFESEKVHFLFA